MEDQPTEGATARRGSGAGAASDLEERLEPGLHAPVGIPQSDHGGYGAAQETLRARTLDGMIEDLAQREYPRSTEGERRRHRLTTAPYGRGLNWNAAVAVLALADALAFFAVTLNWQAVVAGLVAERLLGAYMQRFHLSAVDEERRLFVVPLLTTVTALYFGGHGGWLWAVAAYLLTLLAMVTARGLAVLVIRALRRRHLRPTVILGGGPMGMLLADTLEAHAEYGLVPVGFVSDVGVPATELPVVPMRRAAAALADVDVAEVICAFGPESDSDNVALLRTLQRRRVRLSIIPRLFDLSPTSDHIWGIPTQTVRTALSGSRVRRVVKRAMELVFVSLALLLAAPIMIVCAIAVKVSSPGPVFYRQRRIGVDGEEFQILKFRSMYVGADSDRRWTVEHDPRRTGVGAVIRRWGIDELPQLLNVLKGDMSLIGPRPEQAVHASNFSAEVPTYRDRERVRAGLTGLAQVYGLRGDTSIDERIRFDNRYIDRQSLIMDAFIMLKTIGAIMRGHGSY